MQAIFEPPLPTAIRQVLRSSIKGKVKKNTSPPARNFLTFQPLSMSEVGFGLPPHRLGSLHSLSGLFGFSLLAVFIAPLRRSPSVLRPTSKTSCQVATMVLSEARGLSLFRVIREGLESAERLGARGTQRLTYQWRLALEPERLKNSTDHRPENFQGMGRTRETLKLFVVSDVGRRTKLLSSKRSK